MQGPGAGASAFDRLPEELLSHILGFVGSRWLITRAHAVCRRWRAASRHVPVILCIAQLGPVGHDASEMHWMLPATTLETERDDQNTAAITDWIVGIARRFPHLTAFPDDLGLTTEQLVSIVDVCPGLVSFSTCGADLTKHRMGTRLLSSLAANCPKLAYVELDNSVANDRGLARLAEGCPGLLKLGCDNATAVTDVSLLALAEHCPKLRILYFSFSEQHHAITDVGITAIAKGCPKLDFFALDGAEVTDASLIALAENCPKLTHVGFDTHTSRLHISDKGVTALATHCPDITNFCVSYTNDVTDAGLQALADGCPNLRDVTFSFTAVTDTSVKILAQRSPLLHVIHLGGTAVTDEGVHALVTQCPHLTMLDLTACDHITDHSVETVILHGHRLRDVSMRYAQNVSNEAVFRLRMWTFTRSISRCY
eukprot:m.165738 g.165738  ORF g.165738 m.165738 type:complete len:426 (+) comp12600_c0_seq1:242-1519(+)